MQSSLRRTNLGLVLRTVCASPEPLSRAEVAVLAGSTRATAAAHVDDLVAAGLLDEVERTGDPRPGRPGQPLAPGHRIAAVGLQVEVTGLAVRVLDLTGRTIASETEPDQLRGSDPGDTLKRLGTLTRAALRSLPKDVRVIGAALAVPGIIRGDRILSAPNLGWSDVRPRVRGLTPLLGNEADFAARTVMEPVPGRTADLGDFLYVSADVGIGGAIVRGGIVRGGSRGWTGEIGHVCVDPHGPPCSCGANGCLEQYVGLDARVDPVEAVTALGIALSSVLNVLDMPTVVLAGHVGQLVDAHGELLRAELARRVLVARWAEPRVLTVPPAAGAGATGAALACLNEVLADPAAYVEGSVPDRSLLRSTSV